MSSASTSSAPVGTLPTATTASTTQVGDSKRIAVVGSGIAGLSVAWLLSRPTASPSTTSSAADHSSSPRHVTLFESAHTLGMDAHSIDILFNSLTGETFPLPSHQAETEHKKNDQDSAEAPLLMKHFRIDMPLRVFTSSYYKNLSELYRELNIFTKAEDYSGSISFLGEEYVFFSYSNWIIPLLNLSIPYIHPWKFIANWFKLKKHHRQAAATSSNTNTNTNTNPNPSSTPTHTTISNLSATLTSNDLSYDSIDFLTCIQIVKDYFSFMKQAKKDMKNGVLLNPFPFETLNIQTKKTTETPAVAPAETATTTTATTVSSDTSSDSSSSSSTNSTIPTLSEYLAKYNYSTAFLKLFLLPTMSGILTCSHQSVLNYPAFLICEYLITRNLGGVRRVQAGTKEVVNKLAQYSTVRCNEAIQAVYAANDKVYIVTKNNTVEEYDHVVLACQADQASKLLSAGLKYTDQAANAELHKSLNVTLDSLNSISYERSTVVLHTDPELFMPKPKNQWRAVNFVVPKERDANGCISSEGMATIWLNRAQSSLSYLNNLSTDNVNCAPFPPILQTWNPLVQPREKHLLHQSEFDRPVLTPESLCKLSNLWKRQGEANIYLVGSYAYPGLPLLETAVSSAVHVAQAIGAPCPWVEREKVNHRSRQRRKKYIRISMAITTISASIYIIKNWNNLSQTLPERAISIWKNLRSKSGL